MKTKFGSIIVAGSGKIGGHVASKNRGGSYLRTKVTPANAKTSYQTAVRARFTALSQGWRGLTQDARDAWNAAVADYARTDIFGDLRNPSGINLYQRLNNILLNIGQPDLTLPPLPSNVQPVTALSLLVTSDPALMTLTLSEALTADTACIIAATAPLSAGKNSVTSRFRQIAVLAPLAATPANILAAYVAKFGAVAVPGQKTFVRVTPVNIATGQTGGQTIVSHIEVI